MVSVWGCFCLPFTLLLAACVEGGHGENAAT